MVSDIKLQSLVEAYEAARDPARNLPLASS